MTARHPGCARAQAMTADSPGPRSYAKTDWFAYCRFYALASDMAIQLPNSALVPAGTAAGPRRLPGGSELHAETMCRRLFCRSPISRALTRRIVLGPPVLRLDRRPWTDPGSLERCGESRRAGGAIAGLAG